MYCSLSSLARRGYFECLVSAAVVFLAAQSQARPCRRKGDDLQLTMLLHHPQELDNHLRAWANEDLTLAGLLGVVDGIERIVEDGGLRHIDEILKARLWREVSKSQVWSAFKSHESAKSAHPWVLQLCRQRRSSIIAIAGNEC